MATVCLQLIGASATLTDPARGFRADQWARYCGRHQTAEMIETTARAKLLDKSASNKWTHDAIPRSKTTSAMAPNGHIMQQQQQTSHSGGKNSFEAVQMSSQELHDDALATMFSDAITIPCAFSRFPLQVPKSFSVWLLTQGQAEGWEASQRFRQRVREERRRKCQIQR